MLADEREVSAQWPSEGIDVCVVGAGIAGLTTAYLLANAGQRVVVLDDGPIGGGETERTSAHLTHVLDNRYTQLEDLHGQASARLAAESHTAAIDWIESVVARENIPCEFRRVEGFLFLPPGGAPDFLDRELAAARRAGLSAAEHVARAPFATFDTGPALRFPNQAQFHPMRYLRGLASLFRREHGLFRRAHVTRVHAGARVRVEAGDLSLEARAAVVATNAPITRRGGVHLKQSAYRSYVIAARVPRGTVAPGLFWDAAADPSELGEPYPSYHYVRSASHPDPALSATHEVLLVGGEDHRTGQADDGAARYRRLEHWASERFPSIEQIDFRWSGQILEPADGLAFIGEDEENVYLATGDSGNGLTHGTIAGLLLSDLILGRSNPWQELYRPSRKTLGSLPRLTSETASTLVQVGRWVAPLDDPDETPQPANTGRVLRKGLSPVAEYRDGEGRIIALSAICPHMGCVVRWNDAEQSWDCPCHGSRFDRLGAVLNGPANTPLSAIEREESAFRGRV